MEEPVGGMFTPPACAAPIRERWAGACGCKREPRSPREWASGVAWAVGWRWAARGELDPPVSLEAWFLGGLGAPTYTRCGQRPEMTGLSFPLGERGAPVRWGCEPKLFRTCSAEPWAHGQAPPTPTGFWEDRGGPGAGQLVVATGRRGAQGAGPPEKPALPLPGLDADTGCPARPLRSLLSIRGAVVAIQTGP